MKITVKFNYIENKALPAKGKVQVIDVDIDVKKEEELTSDLVLDATHEKVKHLYSKEEINILRYEW